MHSTSPLSYVHEANKSGTRFMLELAADYLELEQLAALALMLFHLSARRDDPNDAPPELDPDLTLALVAVLDKQGHDHELISNALNVNLQSRKGKANGSQSV